MAEQRRRREATASAVAEAAVREAEGARRQGLRHGDAMTVTRHQGMHELGTARYDAVQRRKPEAGWEAGDAKRLRRQVDVGGAGPAGQQRKRGRAGGAAAGTVGGGRDTQGAPPPPSIPAPPSPPPSPTRAGGRQAKRRVVTSRWQPEALAMMEDAMHAAGHGPL